MIFNVANSSTPIPISQRLPRQLFQVIFTMRFRIAGNKSTHTPDEATRMRLQQAFLLGSIIPFARSNGIPAAQSNPVSVKTAVKRHGGLLRQWAGHHTGRMGILPVQARQRAEPPLSQRQNAP